MNTILTSGNHTVEISESEGMFVGQKIFSVGIKKNGSRLFLDVKDCKSMAAAERTAKKLFKAYS